MCIASWAEVCRPCTPDTSTKFHHHLTSYLHSIRCDVHIHTCTQKNSSFCLLFYHRSNGYSLRRSKSVKPAARSLARDAAFRWRASMTLLREDRKFEAAANQMSEQILLCKRKRSRTIPKQEICYVRNHDRCFKSKWTQYINTTGTNVSNILDVTLIHLEKSYNFEKRQTNASLARLFKSWACRPLPL